MPAVETGGRVVILGAVRTPIGAVGGALASVQAPDLAALAIRGALAQAGVAPDQVECTCLGQVIQDPRATNIAKVAAERAGIPWHVPGTTFQENCASGAAAVHEVARRILLGEVEIGVAGGVESMSNVPRYLYQGRTAPRLYGDLSLEDGLMGTLLERELGERGALMGLLTEGVVERYGLTREEQDAVAFRSHRAALAAWAEGAFADYVVPVELPARRGPPVVFARDEGPQEVTLEELARVRPYFKPDGGTITARNASTINDAGAALVLASAGRAHDLGLKPLAVLRGFGHIGVERAFMGEGAFKVIPPLVARLGLDVRDLDFVEMNEAFAAVVAAALRVLPLDPERVNRWGSGISLGHPVGATGARQLVDMAHQLRRRGGRLGLTTRCVGGGMGSGEVLESVG